MEKTFKSITDNWPVITTLVVVITMFVTMQNQILSHTERITSIEARLDKKDDQYLAIQNQLADISAKIAALNANTIIILKNLNLR